MDTSKDKQKARDSVLRLFRYRPRSEKEIIEKLEKKAFSKAVIQETVEYFKKLEMIDDRLFARGWIRGRLNKPLGMRRIEQELKEKGIEKEIIEQERQGVSDYDEIETVRSLARRRMARYKNIDQIKARQRLYGYLARRGFSSAAIAKALREL